MLLPQGAGEAKCRCRHMCRVRITPMRDSRLGVRGRAPRTGRRRRACVHIQRCAAVSTSRRRRLIINTDAKNEADDQFAIVHGLLSPTLQIEGIIAAHFGDRRSNESMLESRREIDLLLRLMDLTGQVHVVNGAPHAMRGEHTAVPSDGSRLIVEQALKDDERPLYIAFLGLLAEPAIQDRNVVVVWIGGPAYDGLNPTYSPEFNLANDIASANAVFNSRLTIWQIPMSVYTMVGVGYAELRQKVAPCGELGRYLVDQLVAWNASWNEAPIEHRSLGDSPAISVVLNPGGACWRERPRVTFSPDGSMNEPADTSLTVRVVESLDTRYLLEDMFAKLREFAA